MQEGGPCLGVGGGEMGLQLVRGGQCGTTAVWVLAWTSAMLIAALRPSQGIGA